jgi:hypothetical protein
MPARLQRQKSKILVAENPRTNALFGALPETTGFRRLRGGGSSLAKPVSNARFPANSEINWEFFKIGHSRLFLAHENPRATATSVSIPYAK